MAKRRQKRGRSWAKEMRACAAEKGIEPLPPLKPIRYSEAKPGRNDSCPCGSRRKFKKCCGIPEKPQVAVNPYVSFASQYTAEQQAAVRAFVKQWGFHPNPAQLMAFMEGTPDEVKAMIVRALRAIDADPKFIAAVNKLNMLVTPKNQNLLSPEAAAAWATAISEIECPPTFSSLTE